MILAKSVGAKLIQVPRKADYKFDVEAMAKKINDNDRIYLRGIAQAFLPDKVDEVMDAIDAGINAFRANTDPYEHQVFSKMIANCIVRARGDTSGDFVSVYIRLFE